MNTTILLTGNTYFVTRLSRYRLPTFARVAEALRSADVTIANLECTIPDPDTPPAFVAGSGWGATSMAAEPWLVDELRALGIDAVTAGNNHTADFGEAGVLSTIRHLDAGGVAHAGFGASLEAASAPAFVDAASGVRVALISASDWGPRGSMGLGMPWPMGHLASDELPPLRSRPGLNLLRYEAVTHVRRDDLDTLRRLSAALDWDDDKVSRRNGGARSHPLVGMDTNIGVECDTDDSVYFLGRRFVLGVSPHTTTAPCEADVVRMERAVRHARRQADVVMVALHDQSHGDTVHDYVRAFAERMIDAGADVYFNNGGTHKGVAMYRGRPMIFGVPTFFLQTETTAAVPAEAQARFGLRGATSSAFIDARAAGVRESLREGALVNAAFDTGGGSAWFEVRCDAGMRPSEIVIRPFAHAGDPRSGDGAPPPTHRRGLPIALDPHSDVARQTLDAFRDRAAKHGVDVELGDGVGTIRLGDE